MSSLKELADVGEKGELGKYEWKIANWDLNSGWFYWLQCNLVLSDFEGQTEDSNDSNGRGSVIGQTPLLLLALLQLPMYALATRHRQTLKVEPVENRQCNIERYAYF